MTGVFGDGGVVEGLTPGVLGDGVLGDGVPGGVFGLGVFGDGVLVDGGEPGGAGLLGVTGVVVEGSVAGLAVPLHPIVNNNPAATNGRVATNRPVVTSKPGTSQRLSAILRRGFGQ